MQQIYLDNNSTTRIDPAVALAMSECWLEGHANPASQHQSGQIARRRLEQIRQEILQLLGARATGLHSDRLIFTSGGTESNNLALIGLAFEPDGSLPIVKRVLISAIEHPSIIGAGQYLTRHGFKIELINVDRNGVVDLDDLANRLRTPARLVSVMLVNNETGVIQPIREIAERCRTADVQIHSDAVQAVGRIDVDFNELQIDAMTFTAHKFHGPGGIGALILKKSAQPYPVLFGGFQQLGIRPGTEDICLATGMMEALRQFANHAEQRQYRIRALRDRLQTSICDHCSNVIVVGANADRVPHTLNLSFRGINRQKFLLAADMAGLAISTGSACASGSSEPSPVLLAMGLESEIVDSSIRISLSAQTTAEDIELAMDRIRMISSRLSG